MEQLGLCAATTEPVCSRAHVPQLESMLCNEDAVTKAQHEKLNKE